MRGSSRLAKVSGHLVLFYIHKINQANASAIMTTPQTMSWKLYLTIRLDNMPIA